MIDILMVTYHRREFTQQVLEYLKNRTKIPFRLIIVDNGSNNFKMQRMLLNYKGEDDILILLNKNYGLEIATNIGLKFVESDYFVTIDNDILVPNLQPCWLEQLITTMDNNLDYAALALRPQVLIGVGPIFKDKKQGEIVENNVIGRAARIMRTAQVREVGGWTEQFVNDGRGNEEHDICGKLKANHWKVGFLNLWCWHIFGINGDWGYGELIKTTKMGRVLIKSPKDGEFNALTLEPQIKTNQ